MSFFRSLRALGIWTGLVSILLFWNVEAKERKGQMICEFFLSEHLSHVRDGDLEAYLSDFVPKHPDLKAIGIYAKQMFDRYVMDFEIEEIKARHWRGRSVECLTIVRSSRVFRDGGGEPILERAEIKFYLKRVNKQWKIAKTHRRMMSVEGRDR